jgi:hypothetical protein
MNEIGLPVVTRATCIAYNKVILLKRGVTRGRGFGPGIKTCVHELTIFIGFGCFLCKIGLY